MPAPSLCALSASSRCPPSRPRVSLATLVALAAVAIASLGCDEKKPDAAGTGSTASAAASKSPEAAKPMAPLPPKVPDVLVDDAGAYIGGERIEFKSPEAAKKMGEVMTKHAAVLAKASVTVVAMRNAKTPDVVKTIAALSEKAESLSVRTQNRDKKDTTIKVVTDDKAGKLPDCTLAAMVLKDRATASWHIRGGVAQKYNKGMAGPDMSQTAEGMAKQWKTCPAGTTLVLSGDDTTEWGLVFDISQMADPRPPSPTNTYVIPRTTPIAGRAVKIGD